MVSKAVDVVNIDISWGEDVVTEFISLIAYYKGLRTKYVDLGSDTTPAILFQSVQVEGVWPITYFIQETRPYPEMAPAEPPKRALICTLTERVLYRPQVLSILSEYYKKRDVTYPFTLIDLAVTARATNSWSLKHYPWIVRISQACEPYTIGRRREP